MKKIQKLVSNPSDVRNDAVNSNNHIGHNFEFSIDVLLSNNFIKTLS